MKTINVHVNAYYFDISNETEKTDYLQICEIAKKAGFKLFDCINGKTSLENTRFFEKISDEDFTVDTKYIFDNQLNTDGENGYRLHFWYESIFPNRKIKCGYYLSGDIQEYINLTKKVHKCSYCGAQYSENTESGYCNKCIKSEYLKQDQLHLLKLQPVFTKTLPENITPQWLIDLYISEHKTLECDLIQKEISNLIVSRDKAINKINAEFSVKNEILRHGQTCKNFIYYDHTNTGVFNWLDFHAKISESEFSDLIAKIDFSVLPDDIKFELKK
jgi:hypothetical protein